jgi:hypothetical protein
MRLRHAKVQDQTVQDTIRGSVPDGKLQKTRIHLQDAGVLDSIMGAEGITHYGKGDVVERLDMPRGENAKSITIRGHELRHATYSKRASAALKKETRVSELMAYAAQITEDCHVEQKKLPALPMSMLAPYCRAHVTTALRDINDMLRDARAAKKLPDDKVLNSPRARNGKILCCARALAILNCYGPMIVPKNRHGQSAYDRGITAIINTIGNATFEVLNKIVHMTKRRDHVLRATRRLRGVLENEEVDMPEEPIPFPVIEGLGENVHFKIRDLNPKVTYNNKDKKVSVHTAPTGSIIRVARLSNAIVTGDSNGLFARRLRQNPSGTVLIDASGSMSATTENVRRLCNIIPDATVAYYSGDDCSKGVLSIFAMKGKRYTGHLPTETLQGGNSVDMESLQWLLKQPQPWTLISDLGFCGSTCGGEEIAHAIVERESALNRLQILPSFMKAFEYFEAKKNNRKTRSLPTVAAIREAEGDPDDDDTLT